ncbi:unnamed protein product [Urochloa decumbens]|uniref:Uncharacterized protein n=1 Tax=Urochloa decumbens TaxID=240449 RepID=A0ABC8ZHM8_9POAL
METSLLRATAALLPSARARRLGSGRLPLAALPGHDAVVLAGRRVGTGRGGVLTAALKLKGGTVRVKAAGSESGPESGDQASAVPQNAVIARLEEHRRVYGALLLFDDERPEYLTQNQKEYQRTLSKIGYLSYNLVTNVAVHLDLQTDSPHFWRLVDVGCIFSGVSKTDLYSRVSITLLKALDDLCRIVSAECKISLSSEVPEADSAMPSGSIDLTDGEMVAMVAAFYERVKADVECMLEASTRSPPSTAGGGDAHSAPVA